jgi:hypothetical protein
MGPKGSRLKTVCSSAARTKQNASELAVTAFSQPHCGLKQRGVGIDQLHTYLPCIPQGFASSCRTGPLHLIFFQWGSGDDDKSDKFYDIISASPRKQALVMQPFVTETIMEHIRSSANSSAVGTSDQL